MNRLIIRAFHNYTPSGTNGVMGAGVIFGIHMALKLHILARNGNGKSNCLKSNWMFAQSTFICKFCRELLVTEIVVKNWSRLSSNSLGSKCETLAYQTRGISKVNWSPKNATFLHFINHSCYNRHGERGSAYACILRRVGLLI
jgi:hypothetical protein